MNHHLPLAIMLLPFGVVSATALAQDRPPAPVVVTKAIMREITAGQKSVATIRPIRRSIVGSAVAGRVTELVVQEGGMVKGGEPLARLLTNTIELDLAVAEAELAISKQELAELQNGTRPREIAQAKARMLSAKADLGYTRKQLARMAKVRETDSTSIAELDRFQNEFDKAEQTYADLKAAYELAVEGPREEKIKRAEAQVALQNAKIAQIKDRIKKYSVISRFDGYVVKEFVEVGTWVESGAPVMEVIDLRFVELNAFVVEEQATRVKKGAEVSIEVPALPDRRFTGTIDAIIPDANPQARTIPVKVKTQNIFEDDEPLLKSGMYAFVVFPVGRKKNGTLVPKDALVLGGDSPIVFVVENVSDGIGTVAPVPVSTGISQPKLIEIIGKIDEDALVVVEGNERLRPGQKVRIQRIINPEDLLRPSRSDANSPSSATPKD